MRGKLLLAAALISLCAPACAQSDVAALATGNNLYEACTGTQGTAQLGCTGYIMGVADTLYALPSYTGKAVVCLPDGYDLQQVKDVVVKYLGAHPEDRAKSASVLVISALLVAFPC